MEGNLRLKINWASLIVGRKFTGFTLYLRAIPPPPSLRAYIWRGDLTEGFLCYECGGAYFQNFTVLFFFFYFLFLIIIFYFC